MTNHLQSVAIDPVPLLQTHKQVLALVLLGRLYPSALNSLATARRVPRPLSVGKQT